jgi:RND family efflux transporter MFP subunit
MRRSILIVAVLVVAVAGYYWFFGSGGAQPNAGAGGRPGGMGGPGAFARPPMTVELAVVSRANVAEEVAVVGNLIGFTTVDVVPKVSGRLQSVNVRLGDRVARGQLIAQLEDQEIREQVRQAQASNQVGEATIRQREADLKFAESNAERSRNLFGRQLIPKQTLDDTESRYQAAVAQLDLARAQFEQTKARLEELRINLANTRIVSPLDGFVGSRSLDAGAFASTNSPVASVVDIHVVRLVANLVERDLRRVAAGTSARVDVDAYPGETFSGIVARVAPVLDPSTRTAQIEVEIPNPQYRLKPGMYARVALKVDERANALVVPRNAVVDIDGKRGVFTVERAAASPAGGAPGGRDASPRAGGPSSGREQGAGPGAAPAPSMVARFTEVRFGLQDQKMAEVLGGVSEGQQIITTGAAALRDGDPVLMAGATRGPQGGRASGPGGPQSQAGRPDQPSPRPAS